MKQDVDGDLDTRTAGRDDGVRVRWPVFILVFISGAFFCILFVWLGMLIATRNSGGPAVSNQTKAQENGKVPPGLAALPEPPAEPAVKTAQQFIDLHGDDADLLALASDKEFDWKSEYERHKLLTSWCEVAHGDHWVQLSTEEQEICVNQLDATLRDLVVEKEFVEPPR